MNSPTDPTDAEFEAKLRQLLKAEADQVSPSPEGLNLIRERTENNRGSAWFGLPWLRPAVAVAGAVLIATSVIMSTPQVRDQVLEIVPAGADSEGTPNGRDNHEEDGGVAAPNSFTDSAEGTTEPEPQIESDSADPSPEPEEEETSADEDLETSSSCPPQDEEDGPRPTDGRSDEERPRPDTDEDCAPSASPTDEESGEAPGNGDEPGEADDGGSDSNGSGGRNSGTHGDGNGEEAPSLH